jgi:sugar/nucleoside kinase (ribokinase family)
MSTKSGHLCPKGLFVGLATVDISYTVDEIPDRDQKISVAAQSVSAGGPSANAAATFAFLGGRAALVTAVGSHPLGAVIRSDLDRLGIVLHDFVHLRQDPPPVSSILVLRGTGERTVVSANAAVFSPIDAGFNSRWLKDVGIVQVDGHYMPLCIAAARAAHQRGIPVVMDSGSWKRGMAGLLPFIDIAVCSEDYRPPGCSSADDVFRFLAARRISQVAMTRGAGSICFLDRGERGSVAVRHIRAVDTLGAGDIFHGAFCYYASQPGRSFPQALAEAAVVATFSCRYPGTRSWMQKYRE